MEIRVNSVGDEEILEEIVECLDGENPRPDDIEIKERENGITVKYVAKEKFDLKVNTKQGRFDMGGTTVEPVDIIGTREQFRERLAELKDDDD